MIRGVYIVDNRPIGVFDSGVGGLTTVKELHKLLPWEDVVYFGDTGRVPYGTRSRQTIRKYAAQDFHYLLGKGVKAVVAACGTVSTNITEEDIAAWNGKVPYTGVVLPTARAACAGSGGRIGVIATSAAVRSGAYPRAITALRPDAQVFQNACPLFVPMVENGLTGFDNPIIRLTAEMYLAPLVEAGIDTLILGCTHFPLIAPIIGDLLGGGVRLIDAGAEAAGYVRELLGELDLLCGERRQGSTRYFVTDTAESFARVARVFLDEDVSGATEYVDLDHAFKY